MASYLPATNARAIRLSYALYGGPQTATFTVTHAVEAGIALGQVVLIGEHWVGEVVTKRRVDDYQTEVILSGLARRLEGLYWRGKYNTTKDDGVTPEYGTRTISDLGAILTDLRPLLQAVGLDWTDTLTTGINPREAEFEGTVREILDHVAQAAGMAWTVDTVQSAGRYLIRFRTITLPAPGTPEEVSTESVRNVLVIEGAPKAPYNRDGKSDAEVWAYYTDIADFTGYYADGDARFYSDRRLWIYRDTASVTTYGRREERVSVPYIGDGAAGSGSAWQLAQRFFTAFAQPRQAEKRADVIQAPGPGAHESLPWEVGARSVDVSVVPAGGAGFALRVDYKTSLGELLNSNLFRGGAAIRAIPGKDGVDDRTPPTVTLSTTQPSGAQSPAELGSPVNFYATAVDKGTGVSRVELILKGTHVTTGQPLTVTQAMAVDGADPTLWKVENFNLAAQFRSGTKLETYSRAVDGAGNYAFSSLSAYTLDKDPPVVALSVENTGSQQDPGAASYAQVTGPFRLWVNVQDRSKATAVEIWGDNVVRANITASWDAISKRYFWDSHASDYTGKHRFQARVTDAFGKTTTSQEFYLEGRRKTASEGITTGDWADASKEEDGLGEEDQIDGSNIKDASIPPGKLAGGLPGGDSIAETVETVSRRWGWKVVNTVRQLVLTVAGVDKLTITDEGSIAGCTGVIPVADDYSLLGTVTRRWLTLFANSVSAAQWSIAADGTLGGTLVQRVRNVIFGTTPTLGAIPYGTAGGGTTRLPIGNEGQVLTVSGGAPLWSAAGAGTDTKQVKVSALDTAEGYLAGKLAAGANVTITQVDAGDGDLYLRIAASGAGGGNAIVDPTTGNLLRLTTDGAIEYMSANGSKTRFVVSPTGKITFTDDSLIPKTLMVIDPAAASATPAFQKYNPTTGAVVWEVLANGVGRGIRVGFKQG